ncbi:hypothetical protein RND81_14G136400 [Saponaria officinalis]
MMKLGGRVMGSMSLPIGRKPVPDKFPAGLRVLVVDDDPTCLIILEKMLRTCKYVVRKTNRAEIALTLLRENRNGFDIVLSDVHMPDMDGFKLLEHVGLEMNLPVIMMSADDSNHVVMKGVTHGACDYLIKPVRIEALKNIWQHVVRKKKKNEWREVEQSSSWDEGDGHDAVSSPANEGSSKSSKRKSEDEDLDEKDDTTTLKKARVVWSVELHQQFVAAVNQLGIDKAVPKKILELMNVPGLTRENVASHLQKYRLYLRRLSEASQQHGGINNSFIPQDSGLSAMSSFSGVDLQTFHATGQLSGQALTAYARLPLMRPSMSMPFIDRRNLFTFENSNARYGDIQQQQRSNASNEMNLLHGIPTTMEPKQLAGLNQSVQNMGDVNMLASASSTNGHASRSQPLIGQRMQSTVLSKNRIGPVVNCFSNLPGDSIPLGSTRGFTSMTSKGFNQEGSNMGIKAVDGYVGSYDVLPEIQPQNSQEWQLQNPNMTFGSSSQPSTSVNSSVVVPSVTTRLDNQHLGKQNSNHNVNSVVLDNTSRVKAEKISNTVSTGPSLFSEHNSQEDMLCVLLKQVRNSS